MNNLLTYCGLVDVRINASDKDLPVPVVPATARSNRWSVKFVQIRFFKKADKTCL